MRTGGASIRLTRWQTPRVDADRSVRPARPSDAAGIAAAQAAAWRAGYAAVLPDAVLAELSAEALEPSWTQALTLGSPPRRSVLVALEADRLVGFAASGPAEDDDLDPQSDAEVHAFVLDPSMLGQGHGSRLLQATADTLVGSSFERAHIWLADADDALRGFLAGAGWGADGAVRSLDLRGDGEVVVAQTRWHTDLSGARA